MLSPLLLSVFSINAAYSAHAATLDAYLHRRLLAAFKTFVCQFNAGLYVSCCWLRRLDSWTWMQPCFWVMQLFLFQALSTEHRTCQGIYLHNDLSLETQIMIDRLGHTSVAIFESLVLCKKCICACICGSRSIHFAWPLAASIITGPLKGPCCCSAFAKAICQGPKHLRYTQSIRLRVKTCHSSGYLHVVQ